MARNRLELLAPARDLACGVAAIDHGADAVYIGAPRFSARAAAGSSLQEIGDLTEYAHLFGARVYVALNTLLTDRELDEAVRLIGQFYQMGVDAVIIQDAGLLECDLPPIALHASTQMNNRTPAKVQLLEKLGFAQVVLARELNLEQIRAVSAATAVPLEFFIHGALCVSYSGQCYISEVVAGRSANRGECGQFCRHCFTLRDQAGKVLARDRYLLSLKDFNLSSHLRELIDAGISSFKIEGRLKDSGYVKNITAYYRLLFDVILEERPSLQKSSSGSCSFTFSPDPARSFNRGFTGYYLLDEHNRPGAIDSPKAVGQKLGMVSAVTRDYFVIDTGEKIVNGDGLCFFDAAQNLHGVRVNRVAGEKIYPKDSGLLRQGSVIFRNHDAAFAKALLQSGKCREIGIAMELTEDAAGLSLLITDEDGLVTTTVFQVEKALAQAPEKVRGVAERQLRKCGGTSFFPQRVDIHLPESSYYPAAVFNELRRMALAAHRQKRIDHYRAKKWSRTRSDDAIPPLPGAIASYLDNIKNERAKNFYRRLGLRIPDDDLLDPATASNCHLMSTRYCLRGQLRLCPNKGKSGGKQAEPLILSDNTGDYQLFFHCGQCGMTITKLGPGKEYR